MDSLRVYASSIHLCPSRNRQHNPSNHFRFLLPSIPPPPPHLRPLHLRLPPLISAVSSSPQTQTRDDQDQDQEQEQEQGKNKSLKNKVRLQVRLDHQVQFGDHVVIRGSTKELGSWTNSVPLNWTQNGWVCDLEFEQGQGTLHIEFKFVTVNKDDTLVWEAGENRVLKVPGAGNFATVATWDATQETLELHSLDDDEQVQDADINESVSESEASPFVGQWQGKPISFMRSNEHRSHETERKWDTSGLQGLPLKFVQADQSARNWWRKVLPFPHPNITALWYNASFKSTY